MERSGTLSETARPRVAAIATTYYPNSHADVIIGKIMAGFDFRGVWTDSRIEVASLYLDQVAVDDTGLAAAAAHGVPVYDSIGEAIAVGGTGMQVDGVVIVGEHGDYPNNANGQKLYPRRHLYDAAVAAMVAGGRITPIFVDKHLSWSFPYARRMVDTADRLGIELLAGSTVPIAWRSPAVDWPLGAPMTEAVVTGYGSPEAYEFHALEGLQCMAERRRGGETGVRSVEDLAPAEFQRAAAAGRWSETLEIAALRANGLEGHAMRRARATLSHVILVEYLDGLRAAMLYYDADVGFAFAGRGGGETLACRFALQPGRPYGHFGLLVRQIEAMMLTGRSPYPVERTLLTTGILDAAMRARGLGGLQLPTPELAIAYTPADDIPDVTIGEEPPFAQS